MANVFPGRRVDSVNGQTGKVEVTEDVNDTFEQNIPSDTWVVPLPKSYASITVLDSTDRRVTGDEDYSVSGQVTIKFNGAFSGKVLIN